MWRKTVSNYQSPCIGVCLLEDDTCVGCLRTIFEIQRWGSYSAEEKAVIMWRVKQRGRTRTEIRYRKTEDISPASKGPDGSQSGFNNWGRKV